MQARAPEGRRYVGVLKMERTTERSRESARKSLVEDYPAPWRRVDHRTYIAVKDATNSVVLVLPLTGKSAQERKRRVANALIATVNSD
jgi:hypothetical protein